MAYNPILSTRQTSTTDTDVDYPKNSRRFIDSSRGVSGLYSDYTPIIVQNGDFRKIVGINVIARSIMNLLRTPKGSYIFDPEYGTILNELVFEPFDDITISQIRQEVITQISLYDSRVNITKVDAIEFSNTKGYRLNIMIERDQATKQFNIDFTEQDATFGLEEG